MPIDQLKISIVAKSVCLPSTSKYGAVHGTPDKPVRVSRPLGCVRTKNQTPLFSFGCFHEPENDDLKFVDTDLGVLPRTWSGNSSTGLSEVMANSTPRKDSPNTFQRSKRQVFENRYRLAKARSPTREMKSKSANLSNKRVICLPMFRINLEKYTGWDDDVTVNAARRSLKEIMDNSKKRKSSSQHQQAASITNYQFVPPGKESEDVEVTPRRLIISKPVKIPHSSRQNSACGTRAEAALLGSVTGSTDTDRMDIRMDSLELTSFDDTTYSELDTDTLLSPRQGSCIDQTIRRIRKVSDSANSHKYKLTSEYQDRETPADSEVTWPSYEDIKRLRQNIRQHKSANRASQMSGSRRLTSSQSFRGSTGADNRQTSPSKGRIKPIVVPTASVCRQCNILNNIQREPTPCPPNSPSLNESRGVTAVNVRFNRESSWHDVECVHEYSNDIASHTWDNVVTPRSPKSYKSVLTQRSAPSRYSQEVLRMPQVTVKMLESKEELQREASKLHHVKVIS
ncbi:hypothetical protein KP79_PYT06441 [Mizuhopecten yessoensis]|uniref:Uncharacterized protein n=1 Tax=Mizuhopecten yessoensis TaxID=6573 RepID=A0A210R4M8_MIZYE|nr:hypothetical protein KP79_PYT06441 [Mizuhopecten yessoensis]